MQEKKHHPFIAIISFLLFFVTYLIHYSGAIDISIKNATPLALISLLTAFSVFNTPGVSAAVGLVIGICMDAAASEALCFNAIVLMLSASLISAISNNLFNRNIRAATLLSLLTALIYYLLRWLIFYAFSQSIEENLTYLLSYALPSAVYTVIFIFPFYFIYRYLYKIINS